MSGSIDSVTLNTGFISHVGLLRPPHRCTGHEPQTHVSQLARKFPAGHVLHQRGEGHLVRLTASILSRAFTLCSLYVKHCLRKGTRPPLLIMLYFPAHTNNIGKTEITAICAAILKTISQILAVPLLQINQNFCFFSPDFQPLWHPETTQGKYRRLH